MISFFYCYNNQFLLIHGWQPITGIGIRFYKLYKGNLTTNDNIQHRKMNSYIQQNLNICYPRNNMIGSILMDVKNNHTMFEMSQNVTQPVFNDYMNHTNNTIKWLQYNKNKNSKLDTDEIYILSSILIVIFFILYIVNMYEMIKHYSDIISRKNYKDKKMYELISVLDNAIENLKTHQYTIDKNIYKLSNNQRKNKKYKKENENYIVNMYSYLTSLNNYVDTLNLRIYNLESVINSHNFEMREEEYRNSFTNINLFKKQNKKVKYFK